MDEPRPEPPSDPGAAEPVPSLSRGKKILLGLGTTACLLALLELLLTLLGADYGYRIDAPMVFEQIKCYLGRGEAWSDSKQVELGFSIYEDDRRLLWRIRPDLDRELENFLTPPEGRNRTRFRVRTDERGFRRLPPPPDAPQVRIALFGDSHTFGWGLNEEHIWAADLSRELEGLGIPAEIHNFGQPGYSSQQGYILAQQVLEDEHFDVMVVAFGFNDGLRAVRPDEDHIQERSTLGGSFLWSLSRLKSVGLLRSLGSGDQLPVVQGSGPRVSLAAYRRNLEGMAALAAQKKTPVVFVSLYNPYRRTLEEVARSRRAPFLNGDEAARERARALAPPRNDEDARVREQALARFGAEFLKRFPKYLTHIDAAHYNESVHQDLARRLAVIIAPLLPRGS